MTNRRSKKGDISSREGKNCTLENPVPRHPHRDYPTVRDAGFPCYLYPYHIRTVDLEPTIAHPRKLKAELKRNITCKFPVEMYERQMLSEAATGWSKQPRGAESGDGRGTVRVWGWGQSRRRRPKTTGSKLERSRRGRILSTLGSSNLDLAEERSWGSRPAACLQIDREDSLRHAPLGEEEGGVGRTSMGEEMPEFGVTAGVWPEFGGLRRRA
jgi:hypothetical protein